MGVLIENTELLPQYDGYTNLKLLSKIRKTATENDIKEALKKVGLEKAGRKKVKEYSLGMKQKLAIAQAIFEKPDILLLDEPTNGLDESSIEDVRNILLEMKKNSVLILIASHNKEDIEYLADTRLKMQEGRLESVN